MNIKIAERFRPFSHTPGTKFPIPCTGQGASQGIQVYPSALRLFPSGELIPLSINGPVNKFTVILDLEKGCIQVFGEGASGYFRYSIFGEGEKLYFKQEKPKSSLLPEKSPFVFAQELPPLMPRERLSLGVSKVLDWDLVVRRRNMAEILPVWFRLGQMVQMVPQGDLKQGSSLLHQFLQAEGLALEPSFFSVFDTGFSGVFFPEPEDKNHLGYSLPPIPSNTDPLALLSVGANKLLSLFFQEKEGAFYLLADALHHFKHGRMLDVQSSLGSWDLEWTKGMMRRMVLKCKKEGKYSLFFPKTHRECRLSFGSSKITWDCTSPLDLMAGTEYFFDHFQK
jgi:hypothetical protein